MRHRLAFLAVACAAVIVAACADPAGPSQQAPQADLSLAGTLRNATCGTNILTQGLTAPPLARYAFTIWAKQGADRSVTVNYVDGQPFLKFTIPRGTVLRRPNGLPVARGDSVLITGVIAPVLMMVTFQPSGLQFEGTPAELSMSYGRAMLNLDGLTSRVLHQCLRMIWQQNERDPWQTLDDQTQSYGRKIITAEVPHFSRYAVGW